MIDFIVCDDNKKVIEDAVNIINKVMIKNNKSYKIYKFLDYDDKFTKRIKEGGNHKIYILDIETPTASGIDIARKIRNKDKNSPIIFITGHDELGYTVLKSCLNFLTFISKFDDCLNKLELAIEEALEILDTKQTIDFLEHGIKYSLALNNILYVTKDTFERKTIIKTDCNEFKVYLSLEKVNELAKNNLTRTHKSCLVNMKRVDKIDSNHNLITFDNGDVIDLLSNKYKKGVMSNAKCN